MQETRQDEMKSFVLHGFVSGYDHIRLGLGCLHFSLFSLLVFLSLYDLDGLGWVISCYTGSWNDGNEIQSKRSLEGRLPTLRREHRHMEVSHWALYTCHAIMASWHRGMLHGWWFTGFPISTPGCSTKWRQEGKHLKVTSDIKKQYYVPSWNHLQKLVSLDALLLLKCIFFQLLLLYFLYIHL